MGSEDLLLLRQRQPTTGERLPLFFVADGAVGTELLRQGVTGCLEAANLEQPDVVVALHRAYRRAGAEIVTTNTFGANRARLHPWGRQHQAKELNRAAVRLAREAGPGLVAGSVGPSGVQNGSLSPAALRHLFHEQAEGLAEADLLLCETFGDVAELRAAVQGLRETSDLPILASMTYTASGRTPLGLRPRQVVEALSDPPLSALGVNCAVGTGTVERVITELRQATDLPLLARPNAGEPHHGVYPLGEAEFVALAGRLAPLVTILGGCCGTTPRFIAALNAARRADRGSGW